MEKLHKEMCATTLHINKSDISKPRSSNLQAVRAQKVENQKTALALEGLSR